MRTSQPAVTEVESACEAVASILEKYQQQPALLDPHMEEITAQLFAPVKIIAAVRAADCF